MERHSVTLKRYDITKRGDIWELRAHGAQRATLTAQTKVEIVQKMKQFMADKHASVRIHDERGLFQEERTYQRKDDPRSSKG
jgi:hypothetical protein